ncbi:MAG: LolA family protein [Negativicutes bacterium]|jgi:outer membrane lipoprotein-sorting protein
MKRFTVLFLVLCFAVVSLGLAGCGGSGWKQAAPAAKEETVDELFAKGKNLPGMSYDFVMTAAGKSMSGKMWLSDKNMKSEITVNNDKTITIVDEEAKVMYTYIPAQGTAFKMPFADDANNTDTPDEFTKDLDAAKVKVLETTTYDGAKCKVVLVQEKDSKAQTKLWVREDYGIPVRAELSDPEGVNMVIEYKNLKVGAQPADIFKLPAGVEIMDMSDMAKDLPKQ